MKKKASKRGNVYKFKCTVKEGMRGNETGGMVYVLGFFGALVYNITTATSLWAGIVGVFKAFFWAAFLVYEVMKFLGM